jgi:hypothetical protein
MGINWSTPHTVQSGTAMYGGMDKRELWTSQGSGHNKLLVSYLCKNDTIGEQLNIKL